MSGDRSSIAGPEVDMAELEAWASSVLNAGDLNLNLNLGPPPAPSDGLALELALGGHDGEGSVQISRQNWPRFEPGMSGLLLAGARQDEASATLEGRRRRRNLLLVNVRRRGSHRNEAASLSSSQDSGSRSWELEALGGADWSRHEERPVPVIRQGFLRSARRHLRRTRQGGGSALDRVETQASSGGGSSTEAQIVGADVSGPSFAIRRIADNRRMSEIRRNQGTTSCSPELAPATGGLSSTDLQDGAAGAAKQTEEPQAGAHFECNICLEIATEPVVTCCGHLFCWPCLYQWLHVHSTHEECPVCKGSISDAAITPIYGRGSVQDTEKPLGNTPPRPHAHRLNSKRHRHLDTAVGIAAASGRSEVEVERSEPEASNAAGLILNGIRFAQRSRLQERLRLRQRLLGRLDPGNLGYFRERVQTLLTMNNLETAGSLAAIGATMDGLRESIQSMQSFVQLANSIPAQSEERTMSSGIPDQVLSVEERIPPPTTEIPSATGTGQQQQNSAELPQSSQREWHRAVSSASGPSDVEPGSSHGRKRRRLN